MFLEVLPFCPLDKLLNNELSNGLLYGIILG